MSGTSWWRSPAVSDRFSGHDYADFAQEFLCRNADYRRDCADTDAQNAKDPAYAPERKEELARRWGLSFPLRARCIADP